MITPLSMNVEVSGRLVSNLEDPRLKKLAEMILVNSKLAYFHVNDLLDQRSIQGNCFVARPTCQSVQETIHEIIQMVSYTL